MTFSAMLHLLLILAISGKVLHEINVPVPDFEAPPGVIVRDDILSEPPKVSVVITTPPLSHNDGLPGSGISAISTAGPSLDFHIPGGEPDKTFGNVPRRPSITPTEKMHSLAPAAPLGITKGGIQDIRNFSSNWTKGGTADYGKPPRSRKFEFTAYVARYQGDWDSTIWMDGDQMRGGSLQNLLFVIGHLSKNKILANAQPVPLDLSSDEIFQKKPPFIFFTGHRDFHLTDKEIENLAEYLRVGGCIWGDSSLPGQRSRFDLAFRREMRRLLPDPSIQWAPLPASHPIYTNNYFPEIKAVPPGINFYDEPVYSLTGYGGEIAVLYTANDYGDMWQFGIDEEGKIDLTRDEKRRMIATNEQMWRRRNLYFGNIEEKSLFDSYKFGTNVIIHLLTRWEEKIRFAARMGTEP